MKILVVAPCLLTPFYVYRGPKDKEYKTSSELRKLLAELSDEWFIFLYPCPELLAVGWPRPPMSREVLERLGTRERSKIIADFIGRVLTEEKPEKVVFVGVKGSPTCGVFTTTSSNPDEFPYVAVQEFFYLSKEERLRKYKELTKNFKVINAPGLLFEILMARFPEAIFVEFDKDNIEESIRRIREVVKE
ncbi:DUF523 domain-containing protein [Pyrococcus furiosus DSM 3638]|uniref:DUF523 domain-containing protein n=3 Tax=Pyrococcus furiosus TaxID=2261 RepID=Q8U1C7_PYRFU|nr:DUF523 domain-containing protein [Pyrococcus furiosus]AAL81414.1 hypothetical protein PF1290 [Pyrococcus furiosus DSM 3638]AFN04074.1 hypothetical protein PFC_05665 [Pyrococcus furiosus COM1]QEK78931.1 DUF523 domain-containing protein [Pyrococcus furiosus DSM 3638]